MSKHLKKKTFNQETSANQRLTSKHIQAALGILIISMLPYLHNILTYENGEPKNWLIDSGIIKALTWTDGYIFGYSTFSVFVYMVTINFTNLIAWFLCLHFAQGKPYRFVIFFPVVLSAYQFFIVIFNLRFTQLNELSSKVIVFLCVALLCLINFYIKSRKPNGKIT